MLDSSKHQIMQKIASFSDGDAYLDELLTYCVGRLCLKSAKAGALWNEELNSIDVPHIVDWLKAAIINEADWLNNVDEKNRPKKLMKFGSFKDIQKEADKAMVRANQQNSNIKLVDGDEELYMQLEDGYHLVNLLTQAALDREGVQMQHCIGGGSYDIALEKVGNYFLSLRDKFGRPHATLEMNVNKLIQARGKQNKAPNFKYITALKSFLSQEELHTDIPIKDLGCVICSDGNIYDINNMPSNLKVMGNLNLIGTSIISLPENLEIYGDLLLEGVPIKSLPNGIKISGNLYLKGSSLHSFPLGLEVGGDLDLDETFVRSLPEGLKIGGSLFIYKTFIHSLPCGLEVGGNLDLYGTRIQSLPAGLRIGGDLHLDGELIKSLPDDIEVGGDIYGLKQKSTLKANF